MAIKLSIKKYPQNGDLQHIYGPLKNIYIDNAEGPSEKDGQIVDLNLDNDQSLKFDLEHPVNIECQPSYDGTVNLILNDDKNPPRIINSRFSKIEDNKFKIITRNQVTQTNLYDRSKFDEQTRLFRTLNTFPKVDLINVYNSGQLLGGNYIFYIKFGDEDGNLSDIVAESSTVSIFKGYVHKPSSVSGTIYDEATDKSISLKISDIDTSYSNIHIYFSRETCDQNGIKLTKYSKIKAPYPITGSTSIITIRGMEDLIDITEADLNIKYNIVSAVKTQAQVQNMLFFGNVQQEILNIKDLQNLSYYIKVTLRQDSNGLGYINETDYTGNVGTTSRDLEYYSPLNIYYKLGYWPDEMYRLGVVYIMNDDSLSPVFDLRGCSFNDIDETNYDSGVEQEFLKPRSSIIPSSDISENTMGVFKLPKVNLFDENVVKPLYFEVEIPTSVTLKDNSPCNIQEKLRELGVKGYFIVRQPRIQTTLAQGLSIGVDRCSNIPMLYDDGEGEGEYFSESFLHQTTGRLTHDYKNKIMHTSHSQASGLLSADVSCSPVLQSLFDGSSYVFEPFWSGSLSGGKNERHKIISSYTFNETPASYIKTGTLFIPTNTPIKYMWKKKFSTKVGSPEEVGQFGFFDERDTGERNRRLVRGEYSSFIGVEGVLSPNTIYSIKSSNYTSLSLTDQINIRGVDQSPFFAISNRCDLKDSQDIYRGDCYTVTLTVRLNRNFIDPTVPIYTDILEPETWSKNYKGYNNTISSADSADDITETVGQYSKMNRADINSVALGTWVTYKCLSNYNSGIRVIDSSHSDEIGLLGSARSFYPVQDMYALSKVPESSILNGGLSTALGHRMNFSAPNVPYIKEIFDSRVMFSKVQQNNAFQNSYRIFQGLDYQDIDRQYGAIVKFIPWGTNILSIFEHGVGIIPVNEKALLSTSTGQSIHMYGAGVLQNQISVINEDFGSTWQDSIIRTPNGVYGVDTYAKKIWRVNASGQMEIISDMKVQRFLNDHIKLSEKDKYPIISLKNVKSHYNNYKGDVMFTFYNEEKNEAWNLCYNERVGKWITRYSWTPLYSTNIDNIFYSIDQKRAKIATLCEIDKNKTAGIVVDRNQSPYFDYKIQETGVKSIPLSLEGYDSFNIEELKIDSIESSYYDSNSNQEVRLTKEKLQNLFEIQEVEGNYSLKFNGELLTGLKGQLAYFIVNLAAKLRYGNTNSYKWITNNIIPLITEYASQGAYNDSERRAWNELQKETFLQNGLYVHGRAGIIDEIDYNDESFDNQILPTKWYDKQEPFEFEFVVNDQSGLHKIFNNLVIISNNVQPNEIEYEIEGDVFKFNKTGIYRSEHFNKSEWETKYNKPKLLQKNTYSSLYQSTQEFKNCKIKWDVVLNSYTILLTQKCKNIEEFGRRLGNIQYKEDAWYITIDPILFKEKYRITNKETNENPVDSEWSGYKSARLRDKYIKIRIKYTGEDVVIISALKTLITLSYA